MDGVYFLCMHLINRYFGAFIRSVYARKCGENREIIIFVLCCCFFFFISFMLCAISWKESETTVHFPWVARCLFFIHFTAVIFVRYNGVLKCWTNSALLLKLSSKKIEFYQNRKIQLWSAMQEKKLIPVLSFNSLKNRLFHHIHHALLFSYASDSLLYLTFGAFNLPVICVFFFSCRSASPRVRELQANKGGNFNRTI